MEYGKYMLNTSMLHYNGTEENGVGGGGYINQSFRICDNFRLRCK